MRTYKKVFLVLMIIPLLASCSVGKTYNVYEKLYNCYNNMNSFKAKVAVTSYSNNSENKYILLQQYKYPDKTRSEYVTQEGVTNITVISGDSGKIISDYGNNPVILEKTDIAEKDYLMLNTFFNIYYSSEETAVTTSGGSKNREITLTAETGSSNKYRKSVELTVDCDSLNPKELKVYDDDKKLRLKVEYLEFELNPDINDDIFK